MGNSSYDTSTGCTQVALTQAEWTSVLQLAHMWEFQAIRSLAIAELQKSFLTEIDKIVLAHKYDLGEWLLPAYTTLASREHSLGMEEAIRLSLELVVNMARAREAVARHRCLSWCRKCQDTRRRGEISQICLGQIVCDVFGLPEPPVA